MINVGYPSRVTMNESQSVSRFLDHIGDAGLEIHDGSGVFYTQADRLEDDLRRNKLIRDIKDIVSADKKGNQWLLTLKNDKKVRVVPMNKSIDSELNEKLQGELADALKSMDPGKKSQFIKNLGDIDFSRSIGKATKVKSAQDPRVKDPKYIVLGVYTNVTDNKKYMVAYRPTIGTVSEDYDVDVLDKSGNTVHIKNFGILSWTKWLKIMSSVYVIDSSEASLKSDLMRNVSEFDRLLTSIKSVFTKFLKTNPIEETTAGSTDLSLSISKNKSKWNAILDLDFEFSEKAKTYGLVRDSRGPASSGSKRSKSTVILTKLHSQKDPNVRITIRTSQSDLYNASIRISITDENKLTESMNEAGGYSKTSFDYEDSNFNASGRIIHGVAQINCYTKRGGGDCKVLADKIISIAKKLGAYIDRDYDMIEIDADKLDKVMDEAGMKSC